MRAATKRRGEGWSRLSCAPIAAAEAAVLRAAAQLHEKRAPLATAGLTLVMTRPAVHSPPKPDARRRRCAAPRTDRIGGRRCAVAVGVGFSTRSGSRDAARMGGVSYLFLAIGRRVARLPSATVTLCTQCEQSSVTFRRPRRAATAQRAHAAHLTRDQAQARERRVETRHSAYFQSCRESRRQSLPTGAGVRHGQPRTAVSGCDRQTPPVWRVANECSSPCGRTDP